MTEAEAQALLTAEKLRHPSGNSFFVYQDVADALGATAVTDMPNTNFARTNVVFDGDRVFVFKRAGTLVHHGLPANMYLNFVGGKPAQGHTPP